MSDSEFYKQNRPPLSNGTLCQRIDTYFATPTRWHEREVEAHAILHAVYLYLLRQEGHEQPGRRRSYIR